MVDAAGLESDLRKIRDGVLQSFDKETSKADAAKLSGQTAKMKVWIDNFENLYVKEARQHPAEADKIAHKGRELSEEAWHTYEVLLDFAMQAGAPLFPAGRTPAEMSGYASGATRTTATSLLRELLNNYIEYRKKVLKA